MDLLYTNAKEIAFDRFYLLEYRFKIARRFEFASFDYMCFPLLTLTSVLYLVQALRPHYIGESVWFFFRFISKYRYHKIEMK